MASFDSCDSPLSVEIDDERAIDMTSITDEDNVSTTANNVPTTEEHYSYDILDAKKPFPIAEKVAILVTFKKFNVNLLHKGSLEAVTEAMIGFIDHSVVAKSRPHERRERLSPLSEQSFR
jgi:hypothetical protein